ncbi:thioesterase family protein [Oricola cellulosilytica]|uniref:Thioesterase n=1 Tax=Oricola cellulosilytica TaxID=1429082 RepID=A0A4R0PKP8_9HYPH|nr:thioesterase family protein [Oricola cellulosilytica]TCD16129.1 thioesterase [Oricola cellulosilytica]
MNLIFRLVWVAIASMWRPKLEMMDESRLSFRVLPNDLDINIHMNNGRYLTITDLGRVDLIMRAGLFPVLRRRKWYPVIGSMRVSYRRPLEPFQAYELVTRVLGWDEQWLYFEHRFEVGDRLMARVLMKGLFLHGREKVPTEELAAALGHDGVSPELDPAVVDALRQRETA